MPVGEIRSEIQDSEGKLLGYLVHPGLDGLATPEYREWTILYNREGHEAEKAQGKA